MSSLNILPPLIIWRLKKAQYPWIDLQGKESLNFQLSLTLYTFIAITICLNLVLASFSLAVSNNSSINEIKNTLNSLLIIFISIFLFELILQSFVVTFADVKAYNGEHDRYHFTIRVLQ
ncbi:DUF4870 domain-containing protein [Nostocales cyanobacterium LEGE 12452]|nr:DUF4870 domain-containing protein [Nostocales cyanobacterium LEGE 12452]